MNDMQYTPFTLDEANEIAEDFEDLIDTDFRADIGLVYLIDNVMVCPFDEAGKQVFADNYFKTKDKTGSLRFFKGEEFDVIVFVYDADDETSYAWFDIRSFAEQRGIKYSFPG